MNKTYKKVPQYIEEKDVKKPLSLECDGLWPFVRNKVNKKWIWLAKDRIRKKIVGIFIGSRDKEGAKELWNSLPTVYRQCAVCYTDFWKAYKSVLPKKRHKGVGKHTGKINHIERFNNTLRQRVSRLVRKTLSFSKKIENHITAIWMFIHNYNKSLIL